MRKRPLAILAITGLLLGGVCVRLGYLLYQRRIAIPAHQLPPPPKFIPPNTPSTSAELWVRTFPELQSICDAVGGCQYVRVTIYRHYISGWETQVDIQAGPWEGFDYEYANTYPTSTDDFSSTPETRAHAQMTSAVQWWWKEYLGEAKVIGHSDGDVDCPFNDYKCMDPNENYAGPSTSTAASTATSTSTATPITAISGEALPKKQHEKPSHNHRADDTVASLWTYYYVNGQLQQCYKKVCPFLDPLNVGGGGSTQFHLTPSTSTTSTTNTIPISSDSSPLSPTCSSNSATPASPDSPSGCSPPNSVSPALTSPK